MTIKQVWIIAFNSICLSLFGQGANLNNNNVVGWSYVPTNLVKEKVDYSDVQGNCFWNQDWLPALVSMRNGNVFNLSKVKLNFYSNAIHYLNEKGIEVAVQGGMKSIVFKSRTDTSTIGEFETVSDPNLSEFFAQILVKGKIRLLKSAAVKLVNRETDPLLAKKEWIFESNEVYFIDSKGDVRKLKGLGNRNIFAALKQEKDDSTWLKAQHNKLKNENELVSFIAYRNSLAE